MMASEWVQNSFSSVSFCMCVYAILSAHFGMLQMFFLWIWFPVQMLHLSVFPGLVGASSGVFVSQGVTGENTPQVLPPEGEGHGPLSAGGGAGVGSEH